MIPIGTLCLTRKTDYPCSWNIDVAGKIVEVIGYGSANLTGNAVPALNIPSSVMPDHKIYSPHINPYYKSCPEYMLIPISNPGLTDEITKEYQKDIAKVISVEHIK